MSFDGTDLGRTPLNADVPSGPDKRLVLLLKGYKPIRMKIFVEGGKMLGMAFALKPVVRRSRMERNRSTQKTP